MAVRMLSVPPDVMSPATPPSCSRVGLRSALSIDAVIATISASNRVARGHTSGCSGFSSALSA